MWLLESGHARLRWERLLEVAQHGLEEWMLWEIGFVGKASTYSSHILTRFQLPFGQTLGMDLGADLVDLREVRFDGVTFVDDIGNVSFGQVLDDMLWHQRHNAEEDTLAAAVAWWHSNRSQPFLQKWASEVDFECHKVSILSQAFIHQNVILAFDSQIGRAHVLNSSHL